MMTLISLTPIRFSVAALRTLDWRNSINGRIRRAGRHSVEIVTSRRRLGSLESPSERIQLGDTIYLKPTCIEWIRSIDGRDALSGRRGEGSAYNEITGSQETNGQSRDLSESDARCQHPCERSSNSAVLNRFFWFWTTGNLIETIIF